MADNISISRQMVYLRLNSLGLKPKDLRDKYTRLESLILKSNNKASLKKF